MQLISVVDLYLCIVVSVSLKQVAFLPLLGILRSSMSWAQNKIYESPSEVNEIQVKGKYNGNDFLPCPFNIKFWSTKGEKRFNNIN
jgi:hypothetical protein